MNILIDNEVEITRYDQLTDDEIIIHTIYKELYYPKSSYIKQNKEDKCIINEAVGKYCRTHDIYFEHIFEVNLLGDLIPRKIRCGHMNVYKIVNSRDGTLVELEIKDTIKELRNKFNKRKAENEYNFEWIGGSEFI